MTKWLIACTVLLVILAVGLFNLKLPVNAAPKNSDTTDSYIVVLNDSAASPKSIADEMRASHELNVKHVYSSVFQGYSAVIKADKLDKVKNDPRIKYIVADQVVAIEKQAETTGLRKPTPTPSFVERPTGVRRIGIPSFNPGTGVTVAVLDTGISLNNPEFAEKIVANVNCDDPTKDGNDDHGHGTHVAGIIAALKNGSGVAGVAHGAKLVAVKVLNANGSGTWSGVICGIDYVTAHAATLGIKVANMSLVGGGSNDGNCGHTNNDPLHTALCNSASAGVTYVVAAGNNGSHVSGFVPASYNDTLITVSALADSDGKPGGTGNITSSGADDTFASFSNYGAAVDFGAPGVDIYSTYLNNSYTSMSGTSMASPHVAGAAALYKKTHPAAGWKQVRDGLKALSEPMGTAHTDPSGLHPEPVVRASGL